MLGNLEQTNQNNLHVNLGLKDRLKVKASQIRQRNYRVYTYQQETRNQNSHTHPSQFVQMFNKVTANRKQQIKQSKNRNKSLLIRVTPKFSSTQKHVHPNKLLHYEENQLPFKKRGMKSSINMYVSNYVLNETKVEMRKMSFSGDNDKVCKGNSFSKFLVTLRKKNTMLRTKKNQETRQKLELKKFHNRYEASMTEKQIMKPNNNQSEDEDQPLKQMYDRSYLNRMQYNNHVKSRNTKTSHKFYSVSQIESQKERNLAVSSDKKLKMVNFNPTLTPQNRIKTQTSRLSPWKQESI